MEGFNVSEVRTKALATLTKNANVPDESKTFYHATILDWMDYYMEAFPDTSTPEAKAFADNITQLWIDLARMLADLRQFKQAMQVFEDALKDPLVSRNPKIYIGYGLYWKDREKLANAQKAYIRGLSSKFDQPEGDELWCGFLTLMQEVSPPLTMQELYDAVCEQVEDKDSLTAPSEKALTFTSIRVLPAVPIKEEKHSNNYDDGSVPMNIDEEQREIKRESELDTFEDEPAVEDSFALIDLDNMQAQLSPEELLTNFRTKTPSLFVAPNREPMIRGFGCLSQSETAEVESYFGVKLSGYTPSAKAESKLDRVLDVLEALWLSQALKEKSFETLFAELHKLNKKEEAELRNDCLVREARIGPEAAAIRNQGDMNRHLYKNAAQLDILYAYINKTLYYLLVEQMKIISLTKLPYFTEEVYVQLEQCGGLYDDQLLITLETLKRIVGALLTLRQMSVNTPIGKRTSAIKPEPSMAAFAPQAMAMAPLSSGVQTYLPSSRTNIQSSAKASQLSDSSKKKKKRRIGGGSGDGGKPLSIYGPGMSAATGVLSPGGGGGGGVGGAMTSPNRPSTAFFSAGPGNQIRQQPQSQQQQPQHQQLVPLSAPLEGVDKAKLPLLQKLAMMMKSAKK